MQPPWTAFPELPRHSAGWRMGAGEDHYNHFYRMFSGLNKPEQDEFERHYPEPNDWRGFYAMIRERPWS